MYVWAFMTTGSTPFLKKLTANYSNITFHFMTRATSTVVYYEHERNKSIFVSGRRYEIIEQSGQISEKGFVVIDTIPVSSDHGDIFQERVKKMLPTLRHFPNLKAIRFLKQHKKTTFVIILQWHSERAYRDWENSPLYERTNFVQHARLPAYFAERPHRATYIMLEEE